MKHLRPKKDEPLKDYAVGTKDCQGVCNREVIMTKNGPVIVCHGCSRIVMDNRK